MFTGKVEGSRDKFEMEGVKCCLPGRGTKKGSHQRRLIHGPIEWKGWQSTGYVSPYGVFCFIN